MWLKWCCVFICIYWRWSNLITSSSNIWVVHLMSVSCDPDVPSSSAWFWAGKVSGTLAHTGGPARFCSGKLPGSDRVSLPVCAHLASIVWLSSYLCPSLRWDGSALEWTWPVLGPGVLSLDSLKRCFKMNWFSCVLAARIIRLKNLICVVCRFLAVPFL